MKKIRRAKTLLVRRKGYYRKAYTRKGGIRVKATRVKPTTYRIKDRGKPGRGKKIIPIEPGKLKKLGYSTSKSAAARHKALDKAVKKYGASTVWHMLHAQVILRKRTQPSKRKIFKADREYIKNKYHPDITP